MPNGARINKAYVTLIAHTDTWTCTHRYTRTHKHTHTNAL